MIKRIPNLDREMLRLVLEELAQTCVDAKKFNPVQFFDDSVVKKLENQGLLKKIFAR